MDAARRCPGGTSLSTDGPGDTSSAGLPDPEAPSRGGWTVETPGTTRLLNSLGARGGTTISRGAKAFNKEAMKEGRTDHNAGCQVLHPEAAQRTGRLGGSKTLKPATI
ncbi:hypothetical protein NDU88_005065 [Pleurodeles waltl]|uniref:Uncharacterized protein n=1 Tax=Pleurodeles waltl TaxID=8319 RepID=A0AAV7QG87_PLEWA|nr:hypothetical protein NDU88_005065 [Pleurodeles waltl]